VAACRRCLLLLMILIPLRVGGTIRTVAAFDESDADPAALSFLPKAQAFGPEWELVHTDRLDLAVDAFRGGALGVFTGPAGSRILIAVMLVTDSRVAVRRSWEEASALFHHYSGELAYDSERGDVLDRLPPPEGCVEAKRIDGVARQLGLSTGIPMGLTLCAADPDVILLVVASGNLHTLVGYAFSDAVASLMLESNESTPVATPVAS
jgi:hypothetical protein